MEKFSLNSLNISQNGVTLPDKKCLAFGNLLHFCCVIRPEMGAPNAVRWLKFFFVIKLHVDVSIEVHPRNLNILLPTILTLKQMISTTKQRAEHLFGQMLKAPPLIPRTYTFLVL